MIFLGDLACPPKRVEEFNRSVELIDAFEGEVVVVNLEAVILYDVKRAKPKTLYNAPDVLEGLQHKAKRVIVSLANNHMYDYPEEILNTKAYLEGLGVGVFGLQDEGGRILPYEFEDDGCRFAIFGHCWNLYSATNPNRVNDVRVADCEYAKLLEVVKMYIAAHPERRVYCFMHWNYDLETLPFPMHIRFAHDLVDVGVWGVIGSHSHVTQCVEVYKGKPIAYGLGNFYLPSGFYFDGELCYPQASRRTIGLRVEADNSDILLFDTDKEVPVRLAGSISLEEYAHVPEGSLREYRRYFKKNRKKKFLVPVFDEYKGWRYRLKRSWAVRRVLLIKSLQKLMRK